VKNRLTFRKGKAHYPYRYIFVWYLLVDKRQWDAHTYIFMLQLTHVTHDRYCIAYKKKTLCTEEGVSIRYSTLQKAKRALVEHFNFVQASNEQSH